MNSTRTCVYGHMANTSTGVMQKKVLLDFDTVKEIQDKGGDLVLASREKSRELMGYRA